VAVDCLGEDKSLGESRSEALPAGLSLSSPGHLRPLYLPADLLRLGKPLPPPASTRVFLSLDAPVPVFEGQLRAHSGHPGTLEQLLRAKAGLTSGTGSCHYLWCTGCTAGRIDNIDNKDQPWEYTG
jgi:hypothetical protein